MSMDTNGGHVNKLLSIFVLLCVLFVSGCTDVDDSPTVETGDTVSVNYAGMLEDGTVFDTSIESVAKEAGVYNPSRNYAPLTFVVGSGQMIQGFDNAVIGMKVGDTKTVTIPPDEAYEYREDMVINYTMEDFNAVNITPVVGETVTSQGYEGTIVSISGENVTVDFNHRLAGKTLVFDIELVSIDEKADKA